MDGVFYGDLREPHIAGDGPDITLAATAKALYTPSMFPILGGHYFARPGKKIITRAFGKITTAATPGNGVFDIYYGDGTDANGVLLASSAAITLIAGQTTLSWEVSFRTHCRSTGSVGTLFCTGNWEFNAAVVAAQNGFIPASAAVVSSACDLIASKIISLQFRRSGSTAEHMWVQDMEVVAY
jgi:hypothetical protein